MTLMGGQLPGRTTLPRLTLQTVHVLLAVNPTHTETSGTLLGANDVEGRQHLLDPHDGLAALIGSCEILSASLWKK